MTKLLESVGKEYRNVGYHSQTTWSELGYMQAVQGIAQDAIEEYPLERIRIDDERSDYVRESVDSNEYVIYYSANEIALRASQNEPDGDEVSAMSGNDADWRTIRQLATYLAMEADVMEEINRIFWAPFADGAEERYKAAERSK